MPWFEEGKSRTGASLGEVSTLHDFASSIFWIRSSVTSGFCRPWMGFFFSFSFFFFFCLVKRIDTLAVGKRFL